MNFKQPTPTLRRDGNSVVILDQTVLPHALRLLRLETLEAVAEAIRSMQVRGAPLIGGTAAFGVAIALQTRTDDTHLNHTLQLLGTTRPTAVNLHWALARMASVLRPLSGHERLNAAWQEAQAICDDDAATCHAIGQHGLTHWRSMLAARNGAPLRVMTHCNAGWIATLGAGTALAPIYAAHAEGLPVHVWVSETRPRNQGLLTEWELREAGVPHTLISDNAAGILLARAQVDLVITGADRIAANGDTANKVGTYLKALAAHDNQVPFYIAAPMSTVDFSCPNGDAIPIEDRGPQEVLTVQGTTEAGEPASVRLGPDSIAAANPAFDVTPARLITGIITELGMCQPKRLIEWKP